MNLTFRPVILAKLRCLISMRNYRQSAKNIKAGYNFINGYYKLGNSVKLFATFMATGWCVTRFLAEPILVTFFHKCQSLNLQFSPFSYKVHQWSQQYKIMILL